MDLGDILDGLVQKSGMVGRPTQRQRYGDIDYGQQNILERDEPPAELNEIIAISQQCNAVRRSIDVLTQYIFKNGYTWEPKFSKRCRECETEFDPDREPDFCPECGHGEQADRYDLDSDDWAEEPSEQELEEAEEFFDEVDIHGNTLKDLLMMYERWLNVCDDGFLVARQDYELDEKGNILSSQVRELNVANPSYFRMVMDQDTMTPGGEFWVCLADECRPISASAEDSIHESDIYNRDGNRNARAYKEPGECENCGRKLHEVWYVSVADMTADDPTEYFLPREVIHTSKYSHTYGYGYSPIVSVLNMARLLIEQETYMRRFYDEERHPRGFMSVATNNPERVSRVKRSIEDKNVSAGGHHIPWVTHPPDGGDMKWISIDALPEELDYEAVRDEAYRRIAAAFGVTPPFQGSENASGLQNQGPTMWAITELAANVGQEVYNDKVFPQLLELLGVEDWELKLEPVEPNDEMNEVQVQLTRAQHAMTMQQLGFDVERRKPDGDFVFSKEPVNDPMGAQSGGRVGGMAGGGSPTTTPLPSSANVNGGEDGGTGMGQRAQQGPGGDNA